MNETISPKRQPASTSVWRNGLRLATGLFFAGVGLHHYLDPTPYLAIMPAYLPLPLELVYLSGFFEILGGIGLLIERTRRWSAWGLIALLAAVYPANINMLVNDIYLPDMPKERWILWLRMPLQFVFGWAVFVSGGLRIKR